MQTFKTHSKYFIIAALTLSIVGGVFAQVSIPTGLTNAVQYIRETVWTDDGTDSGLVNVQIDDTNIYIRTGFLADGTGWNSKALGLDSSGNVIYVDANAINTPFFNLAGNYIPKINQAGDDLELSSMFQSTLGDISVGHINPLAKMHIQGDFRVDTVSGSLMQYTYTTGSTQVIGAVTAPDPSQLCNCDTTTNALNCSSPSFTTGVIQGNGQGFCVDITSSGGGVRNYRVYMQNTTNINQGAFIVTGNRAGVMTLNPQATLDVNGNVRIANVPTHTGTPSFALVQGPNNEVQKAPFPTGGGTGYTINNVGGGTHLFGLTIQNANNIIWNARSLIAGAGINISSNNTEITISAVGDINNGTNIGGGQAIFHNKQGNNLQFKTLQAGSNINIIENAGLITISSLGGGSAANAWNLTGNTGTNPSTNFIGTIDSQALSFRTANTDIGRLFTNGSVLRGYSNGIISSNNATIGGGTNNQIQNGAHTSTIGGGANNIIQFSGATIGGGIGNMTSAVGATIGGGLANHAASTTSTIGGGVSNIAGMESFVGGGGGNQANGYRSVIVGGHTNTAGGTGSSIGGGSDNIANGIYSTIPGGQNNQVLGNYSSIMGGANNTVGNGAIQSAIINSSGTQITNAGSSNTIIGSQGNVLIDGSNVSTIIGATASSINGAGFSTILGGNLNAINNANFGTILGGVLNQVNGDGSIVGGVFARANHTNTFVWNSNSSSAFSSTDDNQFLVNALGGVGINTDTPTADLHIQGTTYTQGAVRKNVRKVTGIYTVQSDDHIIIIENNGTTTIPQCDAPQQGRELIIVATDTNAAMGYQTQGILVFGSLNMHSSTPGLTESITLICNDGPNQSTPGLRTKIQQTKNP